MEHLVLLLILTWFSHSCCDSARAQSFLTITDKLEVLSAHNNLRASVQPPAGNMERMEWSSELALVAQNYAMQCSFKHNPFRSDHAPSFSYIGENIAITTSSPGNYTDLVKAWYQEGLDYDYTRNKCSGICGHYTQVVWATSYKVGCGVYRCSRAEGFAYNHSLLLVCNYGPGGNVSGEHPYSSGTSCSSCPKDKPHCVGNLCSRTNEMA